MVTKNKESEVDNKFSVDITPKDKWVLKVEGKTSLTRSNKQMLLKAAADVFKHGGSQEVEKVVKAIDEVGSI